MSDGVEREIKELGGLRQPALVSDQAASRLAPSGFDRAQGQYGIFLLRNGQWSPYWVGLPKWLADREADLIEGAKVFVRVSA